MPRVVTSHTLQTLTGNHKRDEQEAIYQGACESGATIPCSGFGQQ